MPHSLILLIELISGMKTLCGRLRDRELESVAGIRRTTIERGIDPRECALMLSAALARSTLLH